MPDGASFRAQRRGQATAKEVVQTPQAALSSIAGYVQGISTLNAGQKNSLTAKLNAASAAVGRGDITAANNQLGAFLNELQADVNAGKVSAATASVLRNTIHAVQASAWHLQPVLGVAAARGLDSGQPLASAALPPADLLPVSRRANLPYRAVRMIGVPLLRLCFRFEVEGRANIPHAGNYVVIANHLNWLDEFALLLLFPVEPRLHFLADPTILVTRKFQWWLIRTTGGYVPVVRHRKSERTLFEHVDRCLAAGGAVAIFPEANYGPTEGELMPFHRGFAHFALKAHVPVIPVALSGTKDLWFRKTIRVVVGPALTGGQNAAALTELAFRTIKTMMPAYVEPAGRKSLRGFLTHLF